MAGRRAGFDSGQKAAERGQGRADGIWNQGQEVAVRSLALPVLQMDCRVAIDEEETPLLGEGIDPEVGRDDGQMRWEHLDIDSLQFELPANDG